MGPQEIVYVWWATAALKVRLKPKMAYWDAMVRRVRAVACDFVGQVPFPRVSTVYLGVCRVYVCVCHVFIGVCHVLMRLEREGRLCGATVSGRTSGAAHPRLCVCINVHVRVSNVYTRCRAGPLDGVARPGGHGACL